MANRSFRSQFEPLEPRALLSHLDLAAMAHTPPKGQGHGQALVGSIQGIETITPLGYQIGGTGTVTPVGSVTVTGFLGYGPPHGKGGAVNGKGTLTLSSGQGNLTLSLKSHGYIPLRSQNAEEIRVTVQPKSAHGTFTGIHVAGTINLFNFIGPPVHPGEHPPVPFSAQINLKPTK